jgi:hypothetical protein
MFSCKSFFKVSNKRDIFQSFKVSVAEKEACVMQRVIHKKEKEKVLKNGQVSEIMKTMGTQMPA